MVMKIDFKLKKPILVTPRRGRESSGRGSEMLQSRVLALSAGLWLLSVWIAWAQVAKIPPSFPSPQPQTNETAKSYGEGKSELQAGTDLTHRGLLQEAIPRLLAAQKSGSSPYAAGVNLGICYVGLRRYKEAIATFNGLRSSGFNSAAVDNLLAQAYLGDGQRAAALNAFQEAAALTPKDETLYDFLADACTDHHDFAMGLHVVEQGLQQLPDSPRLHYERALFLAQMDRLDEARPEFDRAAQLEPGSYIASLALVQEDLYDDRFADATHRLREVVLAGHRDFRTLSLLGTVLMNVGAAPGDPEFAEAQSVLEKSAKENPGYSATQIALGKICIMEDRFGEATEHLEIARRLEPANPSIYTNLAHAYRRLGELRKANIAQTELARLLADKRSTSASPAP
jgi:predicted Zn-dependent protease